MKNCLHCKKEFEPKNPKGKYCSTKCRVYHSRVLKKPIPDDPKEETITILKSEYDALVNRPTELVSEDGLIPPPPIKGKDEHFVEYGGRKSEWKRKYLPPNF